MDYSFPYMETQYGNLGYCQHLISLLGVNTTMDIFIRAFCVCVGIQYFCGIEI